MLGAHTLSKGEHRFREQDQTKNAGSRDKLLTLTAEKKSACKLMRDGLGGGAEKS